MPATLYAIPASHPCAAIEAALRHKQMDHRRVDLLPLVHRPALKRRFGASTVPAVAFADGERVTGSRAIMRRLDERVPAFPLFPADRAARARVERAEEWGEQALQPLARRVVWAALRRSPGALPSYSDGAELPVPRFVAAWTAPLVARLAVAVHHAGDPDVRADLIALPGHLDRIDAWSADRTLGGAAPNAAALQIGASVRLLATLADLAPLLDGRPALALARARFPHYPGAIPRGTLPAAWLSAASRS